MAHLRQHFDKRVDFFLAVHLGHGDQHVILERGIILTEIVAAEDAVFEQMRVDFLHRAVDAQRKLMEERLGETQPHAFDLAEFCGGIMRLLIAKFGDLAQTRSCRARER